MLEDALPDSTAAHRPLSESTDSQLDLSRDPMAHNAFADTAGPPDDDDRPTLQAGDLPDPGRCRTQLHNCEQCCHAKFMAGELDYQGFEQCLADCTLCYVACQFGYASEKLRCRTSCWR